jgi:hypothetical protein
MALCSKFLALFLIHICLLLSLCLAADPFVSYDFEVSYITASPLGVPQQVSPLDLSPFAFLFYISNSFYTTFSGSFHVSVLGVDF